MLNCRRSLIFWSWAPLHINVLPKMNKDQSDHEIFSRRKSVFDRILLSLGCVFVGWIVLGVYLVWEYYVAEAWSHWLGMPAMIVAVSWMIVGAIWLVVILPMFLLVRYDRRVWNIFICAPFLATMSLLIMAVLSGPLVFEFGHFSVIFGAATGLASSIVHWRFSTKIKQAEQCVRE